MDEIQRKPVKYRILAAEAGAVDRRLLAAALGTIDCECMFAASGAEALEHFERCDFDLIVLSSQTPGMPPSAIMGAIRRGAGWKSRIPILLIYPDSVGPSQLMAKAAGADAYFNKPLPISEFLAVVRSHAEAGRQLRQQSLAGWSVLEQPISGIEDLRSPAVGADFDATRLRPGLERGHLTHAILGRGIFSFGAIRTGSALRLRGGLDARAVYFATGLGAERVDSFWGKDLAFGDEGGIIAAAEGKEFDSVHTPGVIRYAALAVPEDLFQEFAHTFAPKLSRIRRPIAYQPSFERRIKATRIFYDAIRAIKQAEKGISPDFDPNTLTLRVLTAFVTALDADRAPVPLLYQGRKIISRVEELVRTNELAVSVPEICSQLGEARHTLEIAFRRELDTSPAHYLRMFQLCRAREELARGHDSVATIAARLGFHHLGQFTGRYRRIFGEHPSHTLAIGKGAAAARGKLEPTRQTVDLLRRVLR